MGVLCAVEHIFNETVKHAEATVSNRRAKANRASHSESSFSGKGESKESKGKSKGTKSLNQGAKG